MLAETESPGFETDGDSPTPEPTDGGNGETTGISGGEEPGSTGVDPQLPPEDAGTTGEPIDPDTDTDTDTDDELGTTGGPIEPPQAEPDGDGPNDPAVSFQLRATAGAPVWVEGPLFNAEPIDTRGLRYSDAVSEPGDDLDVVQFRIVPGQVDPYVRFSLLCDSEAPGRVFADIVRDGDELIDTLVCGDEQQAILLPNASSYDVYTVEVSITEGDPLLVPYTLDVDGFCFQGCEYAPYDG